MEKDEIVVLISKDGNRVLNNHGDYRCHYCGTPENLIIGTLNRANRLQPWCAYCTFIDSDDTPVPHLPWGLHVPEHVVNDLKDVIDNCDRITTSCSAVQKKRFMAEISYGWNEEDKF